VRNVRYCLCLTRESKLTSPLNALYLTSACFKLIKTYWSPSKAQFPVTANSLPSATLKMMIILSVLVFFMAKSVERSYLTSVVNISEFVIVQSLKPALIHAVVSFRDISRASLPIVGSMSLY